MCSRSSSTARAHAAAELRNDDVELLPQAEVKLPGKRGTPSPSHDPRARLQISFGPQPATSQPSTHTPPVPTRFRAQSTSTAQAPLASTVPSLLKGSRLPLPPGSGLCRSAAGSRDN